MISDFDRSEREYRLATYYLNKLRAVDEALRRGQANVSHGLAIFDQEWEHIRHWQVWTTQRAPGDKVRAQMCKEFALAGLEVLANRNHAADHGAWLQAALEAAQELGDAEAERTLCYELEMTHYRLGSLKRGRQFASRLLDLGEAANDKLSIERAYFGLAVYSEERGSYSEAGDYYQRALHLSNRLGVASETGRALNGLGGVACIVGDFPRARQYFSQYLEIMETHGIKSKVCHALLSLGESLIGLKAYAEAEHHLQRAIQMCRELGLQRLLGVGLLTLGAAAVEQDQLEAGRSYVLEGLQAVRSAGVPRQIVYGLSRLGYIDMRLGNVAEALIHLREGLALAHVLGSPRHLCDVQLTLAITYLALNDLSATRDALRESLAIAQRLGLRPQWIRALSIAVAYCHSLGQHEQAAIWAGAIMGEPSLEVSVFTPVRARLEAALTSDAFQQALAQGSIRSLDDVTSEVLATLD